MNRGPSQLSSSPYQAPHDIKRMPSSKFGQHGQLAMDQQLQRASTGDNLGGNTKRVPQFRTKSQRDIDESDCRLADESVRTESNVG